MVARGIGGPNFKMKTATKFAIAWLLLAAIFGIGLWQINIPTFLRLIKHGERATATIVRPTCDNHASASYTFSVGTTSYSGRDVMWMVDCGSLHPGDSITIYYDITNPQISRAFEPHAGITNDLIPIAGICLTFPPFIILATMAWYRKNKAKL